MKPVSPAPILWAETKIPDSFEENTVLRSETGRDRKIWLTSLLFTSSLVTFVITSLPQLLPLPTLQASQRLIAPRVQPHPKMLSIIVSPATEAETVKLSLSANAGASVPMALKIEPSNTAQKISIALPESDRYNLQVSLQPGAAAPTVSPLTVSPVVLTQD